MQLNELKEHLFIVVGEEHYTPLGVIRSLGENGIEPVAIILRNERFMPKIASKSKYIGKLHIVDSYDEVYEILMQEYSKEKNKPFVIPCDDIIVGKLDQKYNDLKNLFYIQNAGIQGRICEYEKKEKLNALALKNGMNVAKTWVLGEKGEVPEEVVYPVITKPFESYKDWKHDYYICNSRQELEEIIPKLHGKVFLQQYIKKTNELCVDGVVVNHGKNVFIAIASRYTYILPDYYSMEMVVENFTDATLQKEFEGMFKEIGFEGIFSAEFMVDGNGKLWFLEINFRNSTWSYASTSVGMNLPLLWAYGMLNEGLPKDCYKEIPSDYIALAEVNDFDMRVRKYKMLTLHEWIKGVRRADCLYYYNKQDNKPCKSVWINKGLNLVKRMLGQKK